MSQQFLLSFKKDISLIEQEEAERLVLQSSNHSLTFKQAQSGLKTALKTLADGGATLAELSQIDSLRIDAQACWGSLSDHVLGSNSNESSSLCSWGRQFRFIYVSESSSSWQRLELVGVTHAYRKEQDDSSFTLGPLNLTLTASQLVFIIGGNGSGKSTLAKLLTGLYLPEAGEIRLDGRLIDDANREWYRQHFSVVFSDFYLFERFLGLHQIDERVQEYLVKLQLEHKVKVEDGRLSTTNLSQGQRKRLALLTVYLEDRPIYLFDEWASDQDPIFKKTFYEQLLPELKAKGKTVLVISHDEQHFGVTDRIVKLDYGQVVENNFGFLTLYPV
jgi:cyclic peptide transporter